MTRPRALFLLAALLVGCATPAGPRGSDSGDRTATAVAPKRITAAITGDPHTLYNKLNTNSAIRGIDAVEKLVTVGMGVEDNTGAIRPALADAIPSLENGGWQVFPDGAMETTWRLREGGRWHDGTPFTADDLLFTVQISRDRDLPVFGHIGFGSLDEVLAVDARTIRVRWNKPYIEADRLFSSGFALPLPKHLLQPTYVEAKESLTDLPHWTLAFIGNGPFKLKEWVSGSHLVLDAFEGYALGRPKLDQIEVRFILDSNTLIANVLAEQIHLTLGRGISVEQALQVRNQWRSGNVDVGPPRSALNTWPQLLNPTPAVVADVRYRKALFHGIDRQAMVDNLNGGLTQVVHSWLRTSEPEYPQLERNIVRYEYDPRKAVQGIEAIGFTRGGDGIFRDGDGQRLSMEVRTITGDVNQKSLLAVADYWQKVGVSVDPVVVPSQRQADLPYRSNFPAFDILRGNTNIENFNNLHSSGARLPENGYRGGSGGTNYTRYVSPQLDALIEHFFATIPRKDRMEVAGELVHFMTDQVLVMGLFYDLSPAFVDKRLRNVTPMGGDAFLPWNAHEWDLAPTNAG